MFLSPFSIKVLTLMSVIFPFSLAHRHHHHHYCHYHHHHPFNLLSANVTAFLDSEEDVDRAMFIIGDNLTVSTALPDVYPQKARGIYFVKRQSGLVEKEGMSRAFIYGELSEHILHQFEVTLQEVFVPLAANARNKNSWGGDLAQKEMSEIMRNVLSKVTIAFGESQGQTRLPLPPAGGKDDEISTSAFRARTPVVKARGKAAEIGQKFGAATNSNERVHLFESAVVTWTKQIKKVLELDAEQAMKDRGPMSPPDAEIRFWETKAKKLNAIFEQLQRDRVRKILRFLDLSKSTYCAPFARLCKEVFAARVEANDNAKFLHTLDPWFRKLEQSKWEDLPQLFVPMLHIILLVWKNSRCYNTAPRLVVLMWQICNALILKARQFVSGEKIFALLAEEEAAEAVEKIRLAVAVCMQFKNTYFEYKTTADAECPSNAWRIPNEAIFGRLDSFVERLRDVLDLTRTVIQLERLEKIEIGGSKGGEHTATLMSLFGDFQKALAIVEGLDYDICSIDSPEFDTDLKAFKATVDNIELRLGSLLIEAFDLSPSLYSRFRLVQGFDNLLSRPNIADCFERRHVTLLEQCIADLRASRSLFMTQRDYPPIPANLPPIAGAITWSSGVSRRVKDPVRRLSSLPGIIMQREEAQEVVRMETAISESIDEYVMQKIEEWGRDVETTSHAKLKLPLLKKARDSGSLSVNFDRDLVRLLREVKYFLVLELPVPDSALVIYESGEVYRRQRLGLEMITNMYNQIQDVLLPVERPLVSVHVSKFNTTAQRGIKEMTWKSEGVDEYVAQLDKEINAANKVVDALKSNLANIEEIMASWVVPLLERTPGATVEYKEIVDLNKPLNKDKYVAIKDGGKAIHKLVKASNKAVKLSPSSEDWKAYVDFANDVVVDGLAQATICSLKFVVAMLELKPLGDSAKIDPEALMGGAAEAVAEAGEKGEEGAPTGRRKKIQITPQERPMLMIRLQLVADKIIFLPDLGENSKKKGITDLINSWVQTFVGIAALVKRVDGAGGTYVKELQNNLEVRALISRVDTLLQESQTHCIEFYQIYESFSHLFTISIEEYFAEFLEEATVKAVVQKRSIMAKKKAKEGRKNPEYKLDLFDKQIVKYTTILNEIKQLPVLVNLGWLLADPLPIKQSLMAYGDGWVKKFIMFIQENIQGSLQRVFDFIASSKDGLAKTDTIDPANVDQDVLLEVMGVIRDIRKAMPTTTAMIEPLRAQCSLLKSHGIDVDGLTVGPSAEALAAMAPTAATADGDEDEDDEENKGVDLSAPIEVLEYLDALPVQWQKLVDISFERKAAILPLQQQEVSKIKGKLDQFFLDVRAFRNDFRKNGPFKFQGLPVRAFESIDTYEEMVRGVSKRVGEFAELEELFELPTKQYAEITDTMSDLEVLKKVWDFHDLIGSTYASWKDILYNDIDVDQLLKENKKLSKQIRKFGTDCPIAKQWGSYRDVEQMTKDMDIVLPIVQELNNPAMKDRHWKMAAKVCSVDKIEVDRPDFSLGHLWDLNLPEFGEDVLEVVETATKEAKIEKKLKMLSEVWAGLCLGYTPYKETEIMMITVSEEVMEALEAHQMELQSMIGMGKFVEFFKKEVGDWQMKLGTVEDTLKVWNIVMKAWASLESIFLESADIRNQLPEDTKRFEEIDETFKDLQAACTSEPNVVKACSADGRGDILRGMQSELELCQKALNDYLDRKKKEYPRFYFVSTRALLDILSNGNNPPRIMRNLTDCYGGIKTLVFKPDPDKEGEVIKNEATGMVAIDGERVEFPEQFDIKGEVQVWLNAFTEHMKLTVQTVLEHAITTAADWRDPEAKPRQKWLYDYPAQVAITTTQIYWTEETETALDEYEGGTEDAVKKYLQRCTSDMHELIKLVLGTLTKPDRKKVISLITMDVHARDMVEKLVREKASNTLAFTWQMQMRLYYNPADGVSTARIIDYRTMLSYEYLGNTGRLVITPLTDRCYITLCTALKLMLSGAPAGPAGTGKTETVKDLSRCFQIAIYVFNGSPQMNYQTIADIFKGLAQSGTWGCFDEFNRISIEVLSIVATQVQILQDGIKKFSIPANREPKFQDRPPGMPAMKVGSVTLMGDVIGLIPTIGIYITMNPGYAGRTELPENLKTLFRSCAMIRPDLAIICEIMLMAEGFFSARELAVKFITLYTLSGALLSPQPHYDWGLRAVRSVLVVAGVLKRASPDEPEEQVLMRALRDFNTPKIPNWDIPIFMRLMADLFPTYIDTTPIQVDEDLKKKALECAVARGLSPHPQLIAKVIQFQELLDVRHSVMLLGPGGCGKTVVWQTLLDCHNLGHSKRVAIAELINPKAITVDELYGYMTFTKDWKDGAMSIIMRGMSKEDRDLGYGEHQTTKWVVNDGDIDTLWIESMNTVMDDNKMLTLVSNERIPLTPAMRMVFEIDSLKNASPATVTRAGILFINEDDIGWRPVMETWMKDRSKAEKSVIPGLFDKYIATLADMTRALIPVVPVFILSKIVMTLSILGDMLDQIEEDKQKSAEMIESVFVFAVIWSFGGLFIDDKTKANATLFDEYFQDNFKDMVPVDENDDGDLLTVFDYRFVIKENAWRPWSDFTNAYEHELIGDGPGERAFDTIFVETPESTRLEWIINSHIRQQTPLMFVGLAGSGKTEGMQQTLNKLDRTKLQFCEITANYYMEHIDIQRELEAAIDKRSGRIFGPPSGKRLVYFIDDFNLPFIEDYGTQSAHSMLRMAMNFCNVFDRDDLSLRKELEDLQYVTAMNPTNGSFTVAERVQRHFSCVAVAVPLAKQAGLIFRQIMTGHFGDFDNSVLSFSGTVMSALFDLHEAVVQKFLPSSVKFMYNWNLRELNNVVRGLTRSVPKDINSPYALTRMFMHETQRVYRDRMINLKQEDVYNSLFIDTMSKTLFSDGSSLKEKQDELLSEEKLIFTSFCPRPGSLAGVYQEVENVEMLNQAMEAKLEEYNENFSIMELVLFMQAMQHVTRISRVLDCKGGNAMLVGVGGSGKQSLSRLAGFICGMEIVQLQISSKFSEDDLKEALQIMFKTAGIKGQGVLFLMTDAQVVNDKFLVYISNILSSGWIPGLFPKEEIDNIVGSVASAAKQAGIVDEPAARLAFFVSRVKANLHLSLCFSPVGSWFRIRARRFPALINCTVIDQFHPWPQEALFSVAARFLEEVEVDDPDILPKLAGHMAHCHLSVAKASDRFKAERRRYNYVTPKSFLELIAFYKMLLEKKTKAIMTTIDRLDIGLSIIKKTNEDVAELRKDLEHTMEKVREKTEATNALLKHMAVEKEKADLALGAASIEADKAGQASAAAEKIQVEADIELSKAKPAMDAANEAVNCLDKNSLNELKGFATPPSGVPDVTGAVLMMVEGEFKNHSWDRAKKMMSNLGGFLEKLQTYDAENMPDKLVEKMGKVLENPLISYEAMLSKSSAAANLAAWVVNVYGYNRIYVKVKPLMDALDQSNADKMAAEGSLALANESVAAANKVLADLREMLKKATIEKQEVEREKVACLARLDLAERLLNGLKSEGTRWGNDIKNLEVEKNTMLGDVLLASAFVSYISPFDAVFRNRIWRDMWMPDIIERGIPITPGIDVKDTLSDESNDALMMTQGLPADRMSLENGAIVSQCKRWPLLIDPQLQGVRWLYGKEGGDNLMLIQLSNSDWVKKMSYAVQNGKTVIIENCPVDIDATLDPILSRQLTKKGATLFVNFASEDIEYDRDFKLYLQTKLANPHFKPEIFAQCTLVNFIATEAGLEDQLLAKVVNVERPELEKQKQELVDMFNRFKVELRALEDDLLERLANAPEDILSDIPLIEGLEKTKAASEEIAIAVEKAKKTEIEINTAREEYRPAASESSMLYFLITDLWQIDHMYRYSLGAFSKFFFKAIARTAPQETIVQRVAALRSEIRFTIFTWVSRGLAEKHKLIYMCQIAFKLMARGDMGDASEEFKPAFLNFLLKAPKDDSKENPIPWLNRGAWQTVCSLMQLEGFAKLGSDLDEASTRFEEWYNHVTPELEKLPLDWGQLDRKPFLKLLVIRTLRPDRMTIAMRNWLANALPDGKAYTEADATLSSVGMLEAALADSSPEIPIFFILSPGADVVAVVEQVAEDRGFGKESGKYSNIALGQGQDIIAMNKLKMGHHNGQWLILNNIHLMPRWLVELEKQLDIFALEGSHKDFRLFLTSEPTPYDPVRAIPIGILARSIKLTQEAPTGLRANLRRGFNFFDEDDFDELDNRSKSIMFSLCHFHACFIERKKFGPKGFNMMYPFSLGDLRDAALCLNNYMENAPSQIPWADLKYLFGEIIYGGHIVNDNDRLLANTYLDFFMRDQVLGVMEMFPFISPEANLSFRSPIPSTHEKYNEYFEYLQTESPLAFGLHPNAEIGFRTVLSDILFNRLLELQPRDASGGGDEDGAEAVTPESVASTYMEKILIRFEDTIFDMYEVDQALEDEGKGPYQNVFIQECDAMNVLLVEVKRSLKELGMGFAGELTMSEKMEELMNSMFLDRVPVTWERLAWASLRSLAAWLIDATARCNQLQTWCDNPTSVPRVTWISGLRNPTSFLTAIKQVIAQKEKRELDKLIVQTEVTGFENFEKVANSAPRGSYLYGLFLDGARWDAEESVIGESRPKEMFCIMPVILCAAVPATEAQTSGVYMSPCYKTMQRGPTWVFDAQLKTKDPPARWVLAGVALVLDVGE
jgi:dynein heavy chain